MRNKIAITFLIGFFIFQICIFENCKQENDPPAKDLGFFSLGEAKDYVFFKPGTWWVYQNTRTGLKDSINVQYSILDTLESSGKKWRFLDEVFYVQSKSSSTGHYYFFYQRKGTAAVTEPVKKVLPLLERRDPFEGDINCFYFPFDAYPNQSGSVSIFLNKQDTMVMNGKIFKDVAIFYLTNDNTEPEPLKRNPAKYYWAKNYGLIRKDLFDGKFMGDTSKLYYSWKLINSKIIQ